MILDGEKIHWGNILGPLTFFLSFFSTIGYMLSISVAFTE